jgi:DNA-binding MarR family transcriptional regulator
MKGTSQEEAWRFVLDLFFRQRGRFLAIAQEFGLAPQQAFALRLLDTERPMTMGELAQALHCDNSNITGIADRLEAAGLVERRAHPTDRRIRTLVLTDRGREIRGAYEARVSVAPPEFAELSDGDAETMLAIMRRATAAPAAPAADAGADRRTSPTAG